MLSGRFGNTTGRPYLEALVILPRLKIESGVSFLVDTGADQTVLMPVDAIKMGINYARLVSVPSPLTGIGGECNSFSESAVIVLADDTSRKLFAYKINILIADKKAANQAYCPSLLGRDILNKLRIKYDFHKKKILFSLTSADLIVPLDKFASKRVRTKIKKLRNLPE